MLPARESPAAIADSGGRGSTGQPAQEKMKYCTYCGAPEQQGARFCPSCGKRYGSTASSFNPAELLNWRPLEAGVERLTKLLNPASEYCALYIRKGADMLLAENYKAPSFLVWNLIALFCCSTVCGFVGTLYSIRVLQLQRNHDGSAVSASKYAKLWFFASVVVLFLVRLPLFLRLHG